RARLGDLAGASQAIERALALSGGLPFLRYTRAEILRLGGDERGVAAEMHAILKEDPRAVEASLELSAMASRRGEPAEAKETLRAAQAAGARDPDLFDRLAQLLLLEGNEAEATALFTQALALWTGDPVARLALGQAALRAGDPARAIAALSPCDSFTCRIELARALVVGPRDLASARRALLEARALAAEPRLRAEVDRRLYALD